VPTDWYQQIRRECERRQFLAFKFMHPNSSMGASSPAPRTRSEAKLGAMHRRRAADAGAVEPRLGSGSGCKSMAIYARTLV
jgi:hypothetical protein